MIPFKPFQLINKPHNTTSSEQGRINFQLTRVSFIVQNVKLYDKWPTSDLDKRRTRERPTFTTTCGDSEFSCALVPDES